MRLTLLGTGDLAGTPALGCGCAICTRANTIRNFQRRPAASLLRTDQTSLLIDASPPQLRDHLSPDACGHVLLSQGTIDRVLGLAPFRFQPKPVMRVLRPSAAQTDCAILFSRSQAIQVGHFGDQTDMQLADLRIRLLPASDDGLIAAYQFEREDIRFGYLPIHRHLPERLLTTLRRRSHQMLLLDWSHWRPGEDPVQDLRQIFALASQLDAELCIVTGISHRLETLLANEEIALPDDWQLGRDGQLVDVENLPEHLALQA